MIISDDIFLTYGIDEDPVSWVIVETILTDVTFGTHDVRLAGAVASCFVTAIQ